MDTNLRLYFESIVRLNNGTNPATLGDQELLGVVGLLQGAPVGYAEWTQNLGLGEAQPAPLTEEQAGKINEAAIKERKLRQLEAESNGNRNS